MARRLRTLWPVPVSAVLLLAIWLLGPRMPAGSGAPRPEAATAAALSSRQSEPPTTSTSGGPASGPTAAPLSIGPPQPSLIQRLGSSSKRVVLAYYVPYDPTSWASFQAQADALDYVDAQWVTVNACGSIGSRDDRTLIAYAGQHGVKVLPSLLTSSGWLNHRLLTDRATADYFLAEIVSYVVDMGHPGFDLDMEGIYAGDRDAYSAFVARLADALHQRGKILTLAIPAKTSDVRTGWAGPYDYAALGRYADLILLMTYDYSWATGPPGSIAPQEWVDRVAAYAVSQMPPEKLLLGLAFYGYDWNTTLGGRATALLYSQSVALAGQRGTRIATDGASRSGTFSYAANAGDTVPPPPSLPALQHDIAVRAAGPCSVPEPTATPGPRPTPGPAPTPRPTPPPDAPQQHVVWLEDATSTAARLEIAVRHGVAGVGAWRLGQEDPGVWASLATYRSGK